MVRKRVLKRPWVGVSVEPLPHVTPHVVRHLSDSFLTLTWVEATVGGPPGGSPPFCSPGLSLLLGMEGRGPSGPASVLNTQRLGLAQVLFTSSWRFTAHIPAGSGNRKPNKGKKYRGRDLKTQKRYFLKSGLVTGIQLTSGREDNGNREDFSDEIFYFNEIYNQKSIYVAYNLLKE